MVRSGKPTDIVPPQAILQISAVDIAGELRLIVLPRYKTTQVMKRSKLVELTGQKRQSCH